MAALGGAPFLKVEATKFTEVGYHGRDVDQIIRDLMDVSMTLTKKQQTEKLKEEASSLVEERILDLLTGPEVRDSYVFYLLYTISIIVFRSSFVDHFSAAFDNLYHCNECVN